MILAADWCAIAAEGVVGALVVVLGVVLADRQSRRREARQQVEASFLGFYEAFSELLELILEVEPVNLPRRDQIDRAHNVATSRLASMMLQASSLKDRDRIWERTLEMQVYMAAMNTELRLGRTKVTVGAINASPITELTEAIFGDSPPHKDVTEMVADARQKVRGRPD